MLKKSISLLIFAIALAEPALGQAVGHEQAIESSTTFLRMPSKLPHSLTLTPCQEGCMPLQLRLTEEATFLSGSDQLSYSEFRRLSTKTGVNATVFFDPRSKTITRIVISK
jgi:hypothetical protein